MFLLRLRNKKRRNVNSTAAFVFSIFVIFFFKKKKEKRKKNKKDLPTPNITTEEQNNEYLKRRRRRERKKKSYTSSSLQYRQTRGILSPHCHGIFKNHPSIQQTSHTEPRTTYRYNLPLSLTTCMHSMAVSSIALSPYLFQCEIVRIIIQKVFLFHVL